MRNVYFIQQAKHDKSNDTWTKGTVVKSDPALDNKAEALQAYHAYLGAYAYGHDPNTDYVYASITRAFNGEVMISEYWIANDSI